MCNKKTSLAVSKAISVIEQISKWSGLSVAWLSVPLVVVMMWEVIARKFFTPTQWAFDVSYMIYGSQFMLATAFCLYKGKHVRADIWYGRWSPQTQGLVDSIMYALLFFPGMALFLWISWDFFLESFGLWERSTASAWRPIIWPFKLSIPVAVTLLMLQGVAEFMKSVRRARGIEASPVASEEVYFES